MGIGTDLQSFDADLFFSSYAEDGPSANFSLDLIEYSGTPNFPDPDTFRYGVALRSPQTRTQPELTVLVYAMRQLEALFKQQETQVDFNARQQTFYEITRYIFDQAYWIGVWEDPDLFGFSDRMINVKMSGATAFFNVAEWDIAP